MRNLDLTNKNSNIAIVIFFILSSYPNSSLTESASVPTRPNNWRFTVFSKLNNELYIKNSMSLLAVWNIIDDKKLAWMRNLDLTNKKSNFVIVISLICTVIWIFHYPVWPRSRLVRKIGALPYSQN